MKTLFGKQAYVWLGFLAMGGMLVSGCEKKKIPVPKSVKAETEITDAYQQVEQAYNYYHGVNGKPRDFKKALEWAEKSAKQGHPLGMYYCGMIEFRGTDGSREAVNRSHTWFKKMVGAGFFTKAKPDQYLWQEALAGAYRYGRGVKMDEAKALAIYQELVKHVNMPIVYGNLACYYADGFLVKKDVIQANQYFLKGAEGGDGYCNFRLGKAYEYGMGVNEDETKAREFYKKGAELLDIEAIEEYVQILEREGNIKEALAWHQRGMERGCSYSFYRLALAHQNGELGFPKDEREAGKILLKMDRLAKKLEDGELMLLEYRLDGRGGVPADPKGVVAELMEAAYLVQENQHICSSVGRACFLLGGCAERGQGCAKDLAKARYYYELGVKCKDQDSVEALERLSKP